MNEAPKHTPIPWVVGPFGEIWPDSDVEYVDGKWREKCPEPRIIASASKGNLLPNEDTANAAFIVRAVNSHDDMLAALKEFLAGYDRIPGSAREKMFADAEAAIAKAEGPHS